MRELLVSDEKLALVKEIIYTFLVKLSIEPGKFCGLDLLHSVHDRPKESFSSELIKRGELKGIADLIEMLEQVIFADDDKAVANTNNGRVYTPAYIAEFMVQAIDGAKDDLTVIDPSCGGGIFLVMAAQRIHETTKRPMREIIEKNIFGIDIDIRSVSMTKWVLEILCLTHAESTNSLSFNIINQDSLDSDWAASFNLNNFTYIVGNPPYYNTHDMAKKEIAFLKKHYLTCRNGVFNIFYAFIEKSLTYIDDGSISFIVPNNFFTIASAESLRSLLAENKYVDEIIDFGDNLAFRPIRTYSAIIRLSKKESNFLNFWKLDFTPTLKKALQKTKTTAPITVPYASLDAHVWHLIDEKTKQNIKKIEEQEFPLKAHIRTGIATLKDDIYFVQRSGTGFYRDFAGHRYEIEKSIVREIYKVPELRNCADPKQVTRYIIFPYTEIDGRMTLIAETLFAEKYPGAYHYLLSQKKLLDARDKGRPNANGWYAYGRTQGLQNIGTKLLFPSFANYPRFFYMENKTVLFCNGYAVFENDFINLKVMQKILNSSLMDYYIKNTSYPIEGGYYCYQKKYVQDFSIPFLSPDQQKQILQLDGKELDAYLWKLYGLK